MAIAKWKDSCGVGGRKVLSFLWPLLVADCEWDMDLSKTYLVEQQGVDQRVPEEGDSQLLVEDY